MPELPEGESAKKARKLQKKPGKKMCPRKSGNAVKKHNTAKRARKFKPSMSSTPKFFSKCQKFVRKIRQKSKKTNFRIRPQIADSTPRSRVIDKTRIHRKKLSKKVTLELRSHKSLYLMVSERKLFLTNYIEADFSLVFPFSFPFSKGQNNPQSPEADLGPKGEWF
jgi:hypothetical protein